MLSKCISLRIVFILQLIIGLFFTGIVHSHEGHLTNADIGSSSTHPEQGPTPERARTYYDLAFDDIKIFILNLVVGLTGR